MNYNDAFKVLNDILVIDKNGVVYNPYNFPFSVREAIKTAKEALNNMKL